MNLNSLKDYFISFYSTAKVFDKKKDERLINSFIAYSVICISLIAVMRIMIGNAPLDSGYDMSLLTFFALISLSVPVMILLYAAVIHLLAYIMKKKGSYWLTYKMMMFALSRLILILIVMGPLVGFIGLESVVPFAASLFSIHFLYHVIRVSYCSSKITTYFIIFLFVLLYIGVTLISAYISAKG